MNAIAPGNTHLETDQVDWISGRTRIFGIVGHPIEQVRSPEMFSAEFVRRGHPAIMIPIHVMPDQFDETMRGLMRMQNLDGLVFTIPFKQQACALADTLGVQARVVGAVNALVRHVDARWAGDIFDGAGCVEGFRRRGYSFAGKRVMLIGAGGAGTAIGVAVAHEKPAAMRFFDPDAQRVGALADTARRIDPGIDVTVGPATVDGIDILLNASPIGMLGDPNMPIAADHIPADTIVFDAIVKPEQTRLLTLAESCGCRVVRGREMMRGQISRMVDFFGIPDIKEPA